jgi:hypothetical protein
MELEKQLLRLRESTRMILGHLLDHLFGPPLLLVLSQTRTKPTFSAAFLPQEAITLSDLETATLRKRFLTPVGNTPKLQGQKLMRSGTGPEQCNTWDIMFYWCEYYSSGASAMVRYKLLISSVSFGGTCVTPSE